MEGSPGSSVLDEHEILCVYYTRAIQGRIIGNVLEGIFSILWMDIAGACGMERLLGFFFVHATIMNCLDLGVWLDSPNFALIVTHTKR